ncbi:MAG: DUF5617 domain-containing protein [Proteobacteria bacterium]|nr:DUF5617 domain-containing protein [Pseudomonadota bacterium]
MPNITISEEVDIYQLPEADSLLRPGDEITIGDLHASAMKFMFMLVKHGLVEGLDKAKYTRLVEIYSKPINELTKTDIQEFDRILDGLQFNNHALVRLIGDELSDRSPNDYFVLKIFQKLKQANVNVQTIISNHGFDFVIALEASDITKSQSMVMPCTSKTNLIKLIEKGILNKQEVVGLARESYLPSLQLISYSLSKDKKDISIYTHAIAGLAIIQKMAEKLGVNYQDNTAEALAKTIDEINRRFQENYVKKNQVSSLLNRDTAGKVSANQLDMQKYLSGDNNFAFDLLLWNRRLPSEWEAVYRREDKSISNHYNKGYKLTFVHGHDSTSRHLKELENLDNNLGKDQTQEMRADIKFRVPNNRGNYKVLVHQKTETQLGLQADETQFVHTEASTASSSRPAPNYSLNDSLLTVPPNDRLKNCSSNQSEASTVTSVYNQYDPGALSFRTEALRSPSRQDGKVPQMANASGLASQQGMFSPPGTQCSYDLKVDNVHAIQIKCVVDGKAEYKMSFVDKKTHDLMLNWVKTVPGIEINTNFYFSGNKERAIKFTLKNGFSEESLKDKLKARFSNLNFWLFEPSVRPINRHYYGEKYGLPVKAPEEMYRGIINLLDDYTRGDSWFWRVIHLNWGRNHLDLIADTVKNMREFQKNNTSISMMDIETVLAKVERRSMGRNPNGSLSSRLSYLREQFESLQKALKNDVDNPYFSSRP